MFQLALKIIEVCTWGMSNPIISVIVLRYLSAQGIPSLFASMFMMRLMGILICIFMVVMQKKVGCYQHPLMNSPNNLAQPFQFSIGIIFIASVCSSISLLLAVVALYQPDVTVVKFMALYYLFDLIFRSLLADIILKRNLQPKLMSLVVAIMSLVYFIVCWFYVQEDNGQTSKITVFISIFYIYQTRKIYFQETVAWKGVISILFSALSACIGHLFWKYSQFKQLLLEKQFNDIVSWANFIKDEPEKIEQNLCVQNEILCKYFEAQIRCFHSETEWKDSDINGLNEDEIRLLIESYFQQDQIYNYSRIEKYYEIMKRNKDYVNFFVQEAIDDPEFYKTDSEPQQFKKLLSQYIYIMQLENQKFQELYSPDKYKNFQFEYLFDDYSLDSEYFWKSTKESFELNIFKLFFEGLFCFGLAFYNEEYRYNEIWTKGFTLNSEQGYEMSHVAFYLVLWLLMGTFQVFRPLQLLIQFVIQNRCLLKLFDFLTPEILFFLRMFADFLAVFIAFIWIEYNRLENEVTGLIGLVLIFLAQAIVYHMTIYTKELKEKLFYINFLGFLTQNQKFSLREGFQMSTMLCLCAQKMPLIQFLKVYAQVVMAHGIQSPDQLRQLRFVQPYMELRDTNEYDTSIRTRLWAGGVPFIFTTHLKYENNTDGYKDDQTEDEDDGNWRRKIIQSEIIPSKLKSYIRDKP